LLLFHWLFKYVCSCFRTTCAGEWVFVHDKSGLGWRRRLHMYRPEQRRHRQQGCESQRARWAGVDAKSVLACVCVCVCVCVRACVCTMEYERNGGYNEQLVASLFIFYLYVTRWKKAKVCVRPTRR
jgi:hypothetical protein